MRGYITQNAAPRSSVTTGISLADLNPKELRSWDLTAQGELEMDV